MQAGEEAGEGPPVAVAGARLTHPDRVLYPDQGVTKRELAAYWQAVAGRVLPHLAGRPLTLVRCPRGRQQRCFHQRHAGPGLPTALRRVAVPAAVVQAGALELHPWGARAARLRLRPLTIVMIGRITRPSDKPSHGTPDQDREIAPAP